MRRALVFSSLGILTQYLQHMLRIYFPQRHLPERGTYTVYAVINELDSQLPSTRKARRNPRDGSKGPDEPTDLLDARMV